MAMAQASGSARTRLFLRRSGEPCRGVAMPLRVHLPGASDAPVSGLLFHAAGRSLLRMRPDDEAAGALTCD